MNIDELADHFDSVKMTARGFTARCPAHDDRTPSLAIDEGATSYLVKCGVGCSFFDIVDAAGLHPLNFKIGGTWTTTSSSAMVGSKARDRMREMRERKGLVLTTLAQIAEVALQPDPEWLAEIVDRYQIMSLPFAEAMKMGHVVMDGSMFNLIHMGPTNRWVENWDIEQREVHKKLWQTYREHGPR